MEEEKKPYEIWQPLVLALVLAVGMVLGTKLDDQLPDHGLVQKQHGADGWDKLLKTVGYIRSRYDDELDVDSVSSGAIEYLMGHLDPHSYFLGGLDHTSFKDRMGGSYHGIGIEYEVLDDTVFLVGVMPNAPAHESGLQIGDRILAIDGHSVSGQQLDQRQAYKIWKSTGEKLDLTYLSVDARQPEEISVEKRNIKINSIPVSLKLDDGLGYIKISHFADRTYQDFMDSLGVLIDQNIRDLIIDVRDNPGGSFQEVVKILNQLVPEQDVLMVYMDGRHLKRTEYRSTGKPFYEIGDLVILVNEHSASASEVLAGALQDLGYATVVGRRTYGKALVQEMYGLGSDASLNLTVGKYYLPSGRFIQKKYSDRDAYENELTDRIANGELSVADSFQFDSAHMIEDGKDILRPVGQGIVPDLFVPVDSLVYFDQRKDLAKKVRKSSFKFYRLHQVEIESLMHLPEFQDSPTMDTLVNQFEHMIALDSVACSEACKSVVRNLLIDGFIRYGGDRDEVVRARLLSDHMVEEALEQLDMKLHSKKF